VSQETPTLRDLADAAVRASIEERNHVLRTAGSVTTPEIAAKDTELRKAVVDAVDAWMQAWREAVPS
jgi:hypothetical protein